MKAIKEAIGVFELRADLNYGLCPADKVALIVLREKLEREKGCPMCEPDVMEGNPIIAKHADGYSITSTGVTSFTSGIVAKFCPMCGRRLEVKKDG